MFGVAGMTANGVAPIIGERVIEAGGYGAYFALAMALGLGSVGISLWIPNGPMPVHHEAPPALRDTLRLLRLRGLATVMAVPALLGIAINPGYIFGASGEVRRGGRAVLAASSVTSVLIHSAAGRSTSRTAPRLGAGLLAFGSALVGLSPCRALWRVRDAGPRADRHRLRLGHDRCSRS
jgi:hypothetical protein